MTTEYINRNGPLTFAEVTFGYTRRASLFTSFSHIFPNGPTLLLGPNGSGKSTLLALAASVLHPREGQVYCRGHSTSNGRTRLRLRRQVGWLPQQTYAYPTMTVKQQIAYAAWLKRVPPSDIVARTQYTLDLVNLISHQHQLVSELSGGQIRRVGLAQALVHQPTILLLDEPTAGLDPVESHNFESVLQRLPKDIFLLQSTHLISSLSPLFEHTIVLSHGRIRFQGTVDEFGSGYNSPFEAYRARLDTDSFSCNRPD